MKIEELNKIMDDLVLKTEIAQEKLINDAIIRASHHNKLTRSELKRIYDESGIIGIYNKGATDMYKYIMDKI